MSMDKSLRKKAGLARPRNVLKRGERIVSLKEQERFTEDGGPYGLPKVRVFRMVTKKTKKKIRRTTMYSSAGKKLYAVRAADGSFKDIQQYSRAHAQDIKRDSADGN